LVKKAVTLATVATEFLSRPGLAPTTSETYEITLAPILAEYGSWSIEIISKQTLIEYLNSLSHYLPTLLPAVFGRLCIFWTGC
jgi:integrase/recombinase XerD